MIIMDLAENLRAVSLEDNAILFSPQAHSQWRHVRLNPIPRYLFRVFTPKSDGHTDATVSRSRDASSGKQGWDEDIFATSAPVETARTIADHLWWRRRSDRADNLVSWTSSILFAVRYMFYRHYDPKDGSPLADINLLILDTSTFMGGTFIRDVDLIAAFKSFDNNDVQSLQAMARLRSRPEFYFGEYLSQGSLTMRGRCSYVSAATMISSGILELHHSFQQASQGFDREKWVKPVQGMRVSIRTVSTAEQASAELLERVLDCASAFEQCWQLPVTVQFLAILPFRLEKRVVYEKIYARMKPTGRNSALPILSNETDCNV